MFALCFLLRLLTFYLYLLVLLVHFLEALIVSFISACIFTSLPACTHARPFTFLIVFFPVLIFQDRVSLWTLGYPALELTLYVDQAVIEIHS